MDTNQAPKNKTRSRDASKMRRKIEKDLQARKKTGDESQRSITNSEVRIFFSAAVYLVLKPRWI